MTTYSIRKLKYSRNENSNLLQECIQFLSEVGIYIVERIRISYFLAFSRVAMFYATTEQKLIQTELIYY
jgi:hypothetical protein